MPQPPFNAPLRVLIADANLAFREGIVRWAAERPDVEVVGVVGTGSDALAATRRLAPDLVLVDVVLPELDGFRVVRALKSFEDPPFAVIASFAASSAVRSVADAVGADGFVPKAEFTDAFDDLLAGLLHDGDDTLPSVDPGPPDPRTGRTTD